MRTRCQARALCGALLVLAAAASVPWAAARPTVLAASAPSFGLTLGLARPAASATCPQGCTDDGCIADSTSGSNGFRCNKCQGNLVVQKATGLCACPLGKYSANGAIFCSDCSVGYYCLGGVYNAAAPPQQLPCPGNMTTLSMRSISNRACVNLPGFSYKIYAGAVSAEQCPVDTYSPGLRKQRACVPCAGGLSTNGLVQQTKPSDCVIPPGYYLKNPGQAAPCPKGEWKAGVGPAASCTKCTFGVTTPAEASTSINDCKIVIAGYFAAIYSAPVVAGTRVCPQKYYCPGGVPLGAFDPTSPGSLNAADPTVKPCPSGMWTVDVGATSVLECLTPPGFKTVNNATVQCGSGEYRADWKPLGQAQACASCGTGVLSDKTDQVKVFAAADYAVSYLRVTTSADDCYIRPGQGLYYSSLSLAWRARNCDGNNYGVPNTTYGLTTYSCRDCPSGMVASYSAALYPNSARWYVNASDGASGFTNVKACVNVAGWGYNGRTSQPCDKGAWSLRDSYGTCTSCGFGLTTTGVGAGKSVADCGIAAGFGFHGGAVVACPIGYYNNASFTNGTTTPCTACPFGSTTADLGADSPLLCNLCTPGYGGSPPEQCGGYAENATYGPIGRAVGSECAQCSQGATGFSFSWQLENDLFSPAAVSRTGADSSWDCLAEFAQIKDGPWYLAIDATMVMHAGVTKFIDCVALCTGPDCQFVTYDYAAQTCHVRSADAPDLVGAPLIAFKAVPSGDVATSPFSGQQLIDRRKSLSLSSRASSSSSSSSASSSATGSSASASASSGTAAPAAAAAGSSSDSGGVRATAVSSGLYSFYQEPNALLVGRQVAAPGRAGFAHNEDGLQQCLNACDDDPSCAGITMQMLVSAADSPTTCQLIYGVTAYGHYKRSVTRADAARLTVPTFINA